MKTVGIIGGAGFIGSFVTKKFLTENYHVKVSTRDLSKEDRYQHLKDMENAGHLEVAALDVRDVDALKQFVAGCNILVHTGTPFQLDVQDPQSELFEPTIKGTENFLEILSGATALEKVIFIASVAAWNTSFPMPVADRPADHLYTESDTPFMSEQDHPYAQAKFIANQTVEKYLAENPDLGFEVVTLSPVAVMGPALSQREDSTSMGLQFLIKNNIAPNPFMEILFEQDVELAIVDVRDVAESVFKAATVPGIHGKNYLISSESWRISDMNAILNNQPPKSQPRTVYSSVSATRDLGVNFKPSSVPLSMFAS